MIKTILFSLAAAFVLSPLLAQDHGEINSKTDADAQVAAGKSIFQQNCGFCHGQDGRGANGPDLIRSSLVNHDAHGELIGEVVHNGRVDKGMPAFQLSDIEIQKVAAFLHQQAKLASTVASRFPTDYPLEQLLVGDAANGKQYFDGPGKCLDCHSPTGDMAHIASKYKPLELQSRIVFPNGTTATAVIKDSSGHSYQGDIVYIDEFFVTLRMDGSQRTWDRRRVSVEVHDPLAVHVQLLTQYTDKNIHDVFAYLETLK